MVAGDSLNHLLGVRTEFCVHVGQQQRVQGDARGFEVVISQLQLGQRKQVGWVFGFQLDGALQMLFRQREIITLDHLEKAQQFMRRPEVRHQRERFLEFAADFRRRLVFERGMPVLGIHRELVLFPGINIKNQKTG